VIKITKPFQGISGEALSHGLHYRAFGMKYVRYSFEGKTSYGILDGETVKEIAGGLFGERQETGKSASIRCVQLLCPCEPRKILGVGWNYQSHIDTRKPPCNPELFVVPTSALLAHEGMIIIPHGASNIHYEGELAIAIGKETKRATAAEAERNILGFTCGNDISEREWQKNDLQWWRAKGCDTFAPLGPAIVAGFDWRRGRIETRVNGAVVQSGEFREMLFDPPAIVSYISQYVTLFPGDVIYTGTPGTTRALQAGDLVEVEIPGIGVLRNSVAAS
jgi:2-keto-4-pentenoate hydratase/2-oxohepta-3-ene-1,7-dioic acid hydratase in catechol pathway